MEVKETAACGISKREFAIEFEKEEIVNIYRILNYAQTGIGFFDEDFLEDLKSQMAYIIGPSLSEDPSQDNDELTIRWEDTGTAYSLAFNEPEAGKLFQILDAVKHPGEGFDKEMNRALLREMMEMAPMALQNLPIINR
jgi:hypothetical protein